MTRYHKIAIIFFALAIFSTRGSAKPGSNKTQNFTEVNPYAKVTVVCYVDAHLFVLVNIKTKEYQFAFKDLRWGIKTPKKQWDWLKSDKGGHFILFSEAPMLPKKDFHWLMFNDETFWTKEKELIVPEKIKKFTYKPIKITTIDIEMMKKIEKKIDEIEDSWETETNG